MLFSGVRQSSEIVPEGRDEDKNQDGQHHQQELLPIKEVAKNKYGLYLERF